MHINFYHFQSIRHALHTYFLPLIKIHELYIIDINETIAEFLNLARNQMPQDTIESETSEDIKIIQDSKFRRLKATINMQIALQKYNIYRLIINILKKILIL